MVRVFGGVFRADQGCAGIGGVDVHPDVGVLCEDWGKGGEGVDGAGGGCAEGEGDVVGLEAFRGELGEGAGKV